MNMLATSPDTAIPAVLERAPPSFTFFILFFMVHLLCLFEPFWSDHPIVLFRGPCVQKSLSRAIPAVLERVPPS